jgi:hypothetical protein
MKLIAKRVFTSKEYKNKFVKIGPVIYDQYAALSFFENAKDIIEHELNKQPTKDDKIIEPYVYKSDEAMIIELAQKKQQIYKELNITKPKNKEEALVSAAKVYKHLAANLKYDQIAQQDRTINLYATKPYEEVVEKLTKQCEKLSEEYNQIKGLVKKPTSYKQWSASLPLLNEQYYKRQALKKSVDEVNEQVAEIIKVKYVNTYNSVLQSTYNVVIRGADVCFGFSYGYAYLLEGLGLDLKIANFADKENPNLAIHAMTVIGTKEEQNKSYYFVDLTAGVVDPVFMEVKENLHGFAFGLEEYKKHYSNYKICSYSNYNFVNTINEEYFEKPEISKLVKLIDADNLTKKMPELEDRLNKNEDEKQLEY